MFTVTEWLANVRRQSLEGKNMKRLLLVALLVLAAVRVAGAQDERTISSQANANVAADFANTSASSSPKLAFRRYLVVAVSRAEACKCNLAG